MLNVIIEDFERVKRVWGNRHYWRISDNLEIKFLNLRRLI